MRFGGARLGDAHATDDVLALDAAEEQAGGVARAGLVAGFLEHLNIGDL